MYSLGNSAPVDNPGYYDVPIHNQYSNPVREGNEVKLSNYALNTTIANTINNNDDNYIVYSSPTKPSPSLYIEQDVPMSGFQYGNNLSNYIPALNEKNKFNERQVPGGYIPPQDTEKFTNGENDYSNLQENFRGEGGGMGGGSMSGGGRGGGMSGGRGGGIGGGRGGGRGGGMSNGIGSRTGGLNMARTGGAASLRNNINSMPIKGQGFGVNVDGGRRDGQASVGFQQLARNQQIAQRPNRYNHPDRRRRQQYYPQVYNNYIPLERPGWGYYNDYLNVNAIPNIAGYYDNVIDYVVEDDYNNENNNYNNNNDNNNDFHFEQEEDKKKDTKIEELDNIKSTNIDDLKLISDKIKLDKLRKNKKNKKSNKPNAIYLVILLLIILIFLMLYLILKNNKKVRF